MTTVLQWCALYFQIFTCNGFTSTSTSLVMASHLQVHVGDVCMYVAQGHSDCAGMHRIVQNV